MEVVGDADSCSLVLEGRTDELGHVGASSSCRSAVEQLPSEVSESIRIEVAEQAHNFKHRYTDPQCNHWT
jgi:hypothetical protein